MTRQSDNWLPDTGEKPWHNVITASPIGGFERDGKSVNWTEAVKVTHKYRVLSPPILAYMSGGTLMSGLLLRRWPPHLQSFGFTVFLSQANHKFTPWVTHA